MNTTLSLAVLVVASMLALAASAPLSGKGRLVRRETDDRDATAILNDVASGLEVLYNISVSFACISACT